MTATVPIPALLKPASASGRVITPQRRRATDATRNMTTIGTVSAMSRAKVLTTTATVIHPSNGSGSKTRTPSRANNTAPAKAVPAATLCVRTPRTKHRTFFRSSVAGLVLDGACEPGTWGWGGKVLRAQLEVSSVVCNELGAVAPTCSGSGAASSFRLVYPASMV